MPQFRFNLSICSLSRAAATRLILVLASISMISQLAQAVSEPRSCDYTASANKKVTWADRVRFYNPFNLNDGRYLVPHDLLKDGFYSPSPDGLVVGISGFAPEPDVELSRQAIDYASGKTFADGRNVLHFDVRSPMEFFKTLARIRQLSGRPIHRLAIASHGESGSMFIGDEWLTLRWMQLHGAELRSFLPPDLFSRDAEIVILSCRTAQGDYDSPEKGVLALNNIFAPLMRQGGTIIASRQTVRGSLEGYQPTDELKQADIDYRKGLNANPVLTAQLIAKANFDQFMANLMGMMTLDPASKFDPIAIIKVPETIDDP